MNLTHQVGEIRNVLEYLVGIYGVELLTLERETVV